MKKNEGKEEKTKEEDEEDQENHGEAEENEQRDKKGNDIMMKQAMEIKSGDEAVDILNRNIAIVVVIVIVIIISLLSIIFTEVHPPPYHGDRTPKPPKGRLWGL